MLLFVLLLVEDDHELTDFKLLLWFIKLVCSREESWGIDVLLRVCSDDGGCCF